jgi:hypothetical protein
MGGLCPELIYLSSLDLALYLATKSVINLSPCAFEITRSFNIEIKVSSEISELKMALR